MWLFSGNLIPGFHAANIGGDGDVYRPDATASNLHAWNAAAGIQIASEADAIALGFHFAVVPSLFGMWRNC